MSSNWKIPDVLQRLPSPDIAELPAPPYAPDANRTARVGLAVESMKRHTSDEGWTLFAGLAAAGYTLAGHNVHPINSIDVPSILGGCNPGVVVMQDKREFDGKTAGPGHDPRERFKGLYSLLDPHIFKVGLLKDAHQQPTYHRESFDEIAAHLVICYYHPAIVKHLAPYVRPQHLVRTRHTVDASLVPAFSSGNREGCLISGAVSGAYPLRQRLIRDVVMLPRTTVLPHPGYRRDSCRTPEFLKTLSRFKVAVCTASVYGYAIRKIIESVACGCVVLTDLPEDDVLPGIDEGLIRVHPDWSTRQIANVLRKMLDSWNPERQAWLADVAKKRYDFKVEGVRLAASIEDMRRSYDDNNHREGIPTAS